jgi:hypothetical protein
LDARDPLVGEAQDVCDVDRDEATRLQDSRVSFDRACDE